MSLEKGLYPNLAPPLRARTYTLHELILGEVKQGRVRIPDFRRPARWSVEQSIELWDSIIKGYPIGSFLFWVRPAEAGHLKIGEVSIAVPANPHALWVVDGLQRLDAIAAAWLPLSGQSDQYALYFAPHTGEVIANRQGKNLPPDAILISTLADTKLLYRWLRERPLDEQLWTTLRNVSQQLHDYTVLTHEVDTQEAQAANIFVRLNTTGIPIQTEEVIQAFSTKSPNWKEGIDLEVLVKAVYRADFGILDRILAMQVLLAVSGLRITQRPEKLSREDLQKLVSESVAAVALGRAVRFLKEDAAIPHIRLLPSSIFLIVLSLIFYIHPDLESLDRQRLARWVWRCISIEAHTGAKAFHMQEARADIQPDSPSKSIDRLLKRLTPPPTQPWSLATFRPQTAASRIELLAMLEKSPLPIPIFYYQQVPESTSLEELLQSESLAAMIVRAKFLKQEIAKKIATTIANRVLLSGSHSWSEPLSKLDFEQHPEAFDSHLIDADMLRALKNRDADRFLLLRAERIQKQVTAFLDKKTAWTQPNLAPLSTYLDEE